jgi:hypothetical protein
METCTGVALSKHRQARRLAQMLCTIWTSEGLYVIRPQLIVGKRPLLITPSLLLLQGESRASALMSASFRPSFRTLGQSARPPSTVRRFAEPAESLELGSAPFRHEIFSPCEAASCEPCRLRIRGPTSAGRHMDNMDVVWFFPAAAPHLHPGEYYSGLRTADVEPNPSRLSLHSRYGMER